MFLGGRRSNVLFKSEVQRCSHVVRLLAAGHQTELLSSQTEPSGPNRNKDEMLAFGFSK